MTRPTAIYRPIERDVLVTDGKDFISIQPNDAIEFAKRLVTLDARRDRHGGDNRPHIHKSGDGGGWITIPPWDYLHLARDIDQAVAVPTIAAAMLDAASCQ